MKLEDSTDVVVNAVPTVVCGKRETNRGMRLYFEVAVTTCSKVTLGSTSIVGRVGSTLIIDANDGVVLFSDSDENVLSMLDVFFSDVELSELILPTLLNGTSCS